MLDYIICSHCQNPNTVDSIKSLIRALNTEVDKALHYAERHKQFKSRINSIIKQMICSMDVDVQSTNEDFKNWINELLVFNKITSNPDYEIIDMEYSLPNGKSLDYKLRSKPTNDYLYIEVCTIQNMNPADHEKDETINDYLNNRIKKKYESKISNLDSIHSEGIVHFYILPIVEYKKGMEKFTFKVDKNIAFTPLTICKNGENECLLMPLNDFLKNEKQ